MPSRLPVKLALIDDHTLFRRGLISLIKMVGDHYIILFEADNGLQLQKKIDRHDLPDIIIMDVNMPGMDGFESVRWLNEHFPLVKVLVVSMIEKEDTIMQMVKLGVKGYLCKDVEPEELGEALEAVMNKGFYYTDFLTGKLVHSIRSNGDNGDIARAIQPINDQEKKFLQMACSELTYHEIAARMFLSPKTIDGYRDKLFEKLQVKNRVGLALYAVKQGLVEL